MSSGYTYYTPSSLADNDSATPERNQLSQGSHLTPNTLSNSASPALNNTQTPEESLEALNNQYQYQQIDFGDNDDPFFGVNFSSIEDGSPSFLEADFLQIANSDHFADRTSSEPVQKTQNAFLGANHLPMSPEKTPSLQTSPNPEAGSNQATFPKRSAISVNTQEVTHRPKQPSLSDSQDSSQPGYELTPETTNSAELGDDGSVPSINVMSEQSPRVTVSNWDNINSYTLNNAQHNALHPGVNQNDFANQTSDGNMSPSSTLARDGSVRWAPDQVAGRSGVAPGDRSSAEVRSVNELAAEKQVQERNEEVDAWMAKLKAVGRTKSGFVDVNQPFIRPLDHDDESIDPREIGMEPSENKKISGQTYFTEKGGEMTAEDRAIIYGNRNWADAPLSLPITSERHQPETSQDAIRKFEQMCKDNGSIISRAATWGTRRRSIGTIDAEVENAGNFLKKLSLSRGDSLRRPSAIIQELRGLVRRPSNAKRTRAENEENASNSTRSSVDRKESQGSLNLAPPSRTGSLGKKQSVPSINTALVAMGSNVASIGAAHARNGSISTTPITSPNAKSPARNLSVNFSNRFRSRSDASTRKEPNNTLAGMLKNHGGPPVPSLPRPSAEPKPSAEVIEIDDDSDEEDDEDGAGDSNADSSASIVNIKPTQDGFKQHFLELHPKLPEKSRYLVDRVAYQQMVRYKALLNHKKEHEQHLMNKSCPSGSMCIKSGGKAKLLKTNPSGRGLSVRSEEDMPPGDKMINPNQFPANIPPPITRDLPAELECQLCFQAKKFEKPSDWTKHVHEDVSPFACTWENCRDGNKTFKRKADWVRHENEGHRHLEWWKCRVDDCNHDCFRRDNFLQHLVREHKFQEPKYKTKGDIRKAGGARHPTWQMVEKCHRVTERRPDQEPCRFCGEKLTTWKKLTVHLAKHMEQISLPIIKLVERTEVDPDTIISPVQEPPPRHFPPPIPQNNDRRHSGQPHMQQRFDPAIAGMSHMPMRQMPMSYPSTPQQHPGFGYQPFPQPGYQPMPFGDLSQGMMASGSMNMPMGQQPMNQGYPNLITSQPAYTTMPMTTTAGYMTSPMSASQMGVSSQLTTPLMGTPLMGAPPNQFMGVSPDGTGTEAFPGMDLNMNMNALGLQDPASLGYGNMNGGGGMLMDTSLTPTPSQNNSRPHSQNGHHHGRQHSHGHVNAQFMPMTGPPHGSVSPFGTSPMPGQNGFY